ncbi:phosphatase 2C-like domain-containing protein [Scheffersomyces xylosifermentans]|uniref:phosphatase 2C-like domain-containing protein n=1 Tax=Scheffersomyces xylosifermentans TaxID=1304137 RepID=UPI00315C707F
MLKTTRVVPQLAKVVATRTFNTTPLFQGARNYFRSFAEEAPEATDDVNPFIQYPLVTKEQMKKISNDKFKFEFAYTSFAFHSTSSVPLIHSLSDLTDPTSLNSLLPKRRPQGSPADTLSIRAGDDTMLVSPSVLAVADGVSSWEGNKDGDAGIWSRSMVETFSRLMTEYKLSHTPHHLNNRDISEILDDSFLHTSHLMDLQKLEGSSTLILGMLSGDELKMVSIGDSKIYVIRDGKVIKENEEQMVSDLCPQQIGTQTLTQLPSEIAWVDSIKLKENDLVVVCSDGISDNLYEWEIVDYLDEFLNKKKDSLKRAVNKLLLKAKEVSFDDYAFTPYNEKVNALPEKKFGKKNSTGGKLDDMSICIGKVVLNNKK